MFTPKDYYVILNDTESPGFMPALMQIEPDDDHAPLQEMQGRVLQAGAVSEPRPLFAEAGCPFHAAIALVALRPGCRAPENPYGRRIAIGCGATPETARALALAEAAERFSIQFSTELPATLPPFMTWNGRPEPAAVPELTLGAPGTAGQVLSVGAAAGTSLEDAATRALLELIEHHHAAALADQSSSPACVAADPARVAAVRPHVDWLESHLRLLRCRVHANHLYVFAACRCSDRDGGRPTTGFAAGPTVAGAMRHAAEEAILAWRNMVAIEHSAMRLERLSSDEREAVWCYRGALPRPAWSSPALAPPDPSDADGPPRPVALIDAVARLTGRRVRLFDMTDAALGIPVVKAHIG